MSKRTRAQRLRATGVPVVRVAPLKDRLEASAIQQEDGTWLVPVEIAAELARVQGEQDAKKLAISRGRTFGRGKMATTVKKPR